MLVRESRADKLTEISTREVRTGQLQRLTREESEKLGAAVANALGKTISVDSPEPSLDYAQAHVFERVSVAPDYQILTEALRYGRGSISHRELRGTLAQREIRGAILRDGEEIATRAASNVNAR